MNEQGQVEFEVEVTPIATVLIVAGKAGFEFEIINEDLPEETLADLLRAAADMLEGKDDRAAGMWGR